MQWNQIIKYLLNHVYLKPTGNLGILNAVESNYKLPAESYTSETPTTIENTEKSSSGSFIQRFSTPLIVLQHNKCYSTPKKRQKSDSDDIEKSLLSLFTTIADKLRNSNTQSNSNKIEKDPEDIFAE